MLKVPNKEMLGMLRKEYPAGTRVELVSMPPDGYSPPPPIGTKGTVISVDDVGTIHVAWDNGSSLGVTFDTDKCRKIQ